MSEKLPYEQQLSQQWDDLSLPDENRAWDDMKRRLDKKDDDGIIVPPPPKGCSGLSILLGLLLLTCVWWFVKPEKWFIKKEDKVAEQAKADNSKETGNNINNEPLIDDTANLSTEKYSGQKEKPDNTEKGGMIKSKDSVRAIVNSDTKTNIAGKTTDSNKESPTGLKKINELKKEKQSKTDTKKVEDKRTDSDKMPVLPDNANLLSKKEQPDLTVYEETKEDEIQKDIKKDAVIAITLSDTAQNRKADNVTEKINPDQNIRNINESKENVARRPVFFSAGVGLHQQLPVGGQKWTSYGSLGRKGILSDYIPSVNFRVEKEQRWFLQSEFRYGAPQHTKQFTYGQKIITDTAGQTADITSTILKKTFYHQVNLIFNYYAGTRWSLGAGIVWNKFHGAVSEQELKRKNLVTQSESVISKTIIKVRADSSLAKSWLQAVFQAQYQWKRYSAGIRYSAGLQPYIEFTLPGTGEQRERNSSLQLFLRYELWKSRRD